MANQYTGRQGQQPTQRPPVRHKKKKKKNTLPVVLGIVGALVVICACALGYLLLRDDGKIAKNVFVGGIDLGGKTKEEAKAALSELRFEDPMNIRLYTMGNGFPTYVTTYDPSKDIPTDIFGDPVENAQSAAPSEAPPVQTDPDAPLNQDGKPYLLDKTIVLPASNVEITLDVDAAVDEAYRYGRGSKDAPKEPMDIDVSDYLTVNETYIREVLESTLEDTVLHGSETIIEDGTTLINDKDGNPQTVDAIMITIGSLERDLNIDTLYHEIIAAYMSGNYDLQYIYDEKIPEPVDLDRLYEDYHCVAPVNAVCDRDTYEVTDGKNGFGFRMSEAVEALEKAQAGDTVTLALRELEPEFTRENLESELFCDVLASYDSPHVWNPTRTHNLELACQTINGTILKPGDVFSFNGIVGERTADKGYGEAGVYVGGKTENQLGGGVCQVASTIFWCTMKADLEVIERAEHQFTPSYIPWGMDATIYWGSLDYKFRNNTSYPIRIDASVSDGYVHVTFVGTDTKDYTVKLDYVITGYYNAEEKVVDISPDMPNYAEYAGYSEGEVIQTSYDGASVTTYMEKYTLDGELISREPIFYSNYDSRDRLIAHIVTEEESSESSENTEPTEESSEATEPPESSEEPSSEPSSESEEQPESGGEA